ncbi:MAG TPA: GNAT family N-acetyltransferase [Mucilaginibacter sp.]|nr:GNAT family N-acetyltransferase [Mucilaginibacter sp.]
MHIKRLTLQDYAPVIPLFNNYRVFYKQSSDIKLAEDFIRCRLENNESVIFLALQDDGSQPVAAGFTQLYPLISSVRAKRNWLLNDLYVDKAFRRQGIGEALIRAAMDFARADGASFVKLETAVDNFTAQSLYEAVGFEKIPPGSSFLTYQIPL